MLFIIFAVTDEEIFFAQRSEQKKARTAPNTVDKTPRQNVISS